MVIKFNVVEKGYPNEPKTLMKFYAQAIMSGEQNISK